MRPADEAAHPGARLEHWELTMGGAFPGRVRLTLGAGAAAFLVDVDLGADGRLVVADEDVPPPRAGLDLRADGLWTSVCCETPFEHWTFGLEAFGLRLDDPPPPDVRWSDLVGDRLAVGYDLEWEATGAPTPLPAGDGDGYRIAGRVVGELMTVHDRWEVAAEADWEHWWVVPGAPAQGALSGHP